MRIRVKAGVILVGMLLLTPASAPVVSAATDTDHDGLSDRFERVWSHTSPYRADTNRNGIPDGREDPDRDGLTNLQEQRVGTNPLRADSDGDHIRDDHEDPDRDGLWNRTEFAARTNPRIADTDRDGLRDDREDPDRDGLTNRVEQRLGTDPRRTDSNGNGVPDGLEDPDGDGLSTLAEIRGGTDPMKADTDGDGILDGHTPPPGLGGAPVLPGAPACMVFPADNVWNVPVDGLPVLAGGSTYIDSIGRSSTFHMDFGSWSGYGIPYQVVGAATPRAAVTFDYADESDPGPYPIPVSPLIEAGSDRHVLMVDRDACRLYELYDVRRSAAGGWAAGSGAIWDLASNALRPAGWTSADAAGLPMLPGLVRYDEVAAGVISHALRFTAPATSRSYIYPARHFASSSTSAALPPMGLRLRLSPTADLSGLSHDALVIAVALQRYGMILADNGSPWYVSGMSDPRFSDDVLHELDRFTGNDLQVVDTSGLVSTP